MLEDLGTPMGNLDTMIVARPCGRNIPVTTTVFSSAQSSSKLKTGRNLASLGYLP
jgi:hypothetical protein